MTIRNIMKRKIFCILSILLISVLTSYAAEPVITPDGTYMFCKRDTCDLFLDVYNPVKDSQTSIKGIEKPTIVFMFGGGFIRGTRDDDSYHAWFKHMTENGYRIISKIGRAHV